MRVFADWRDIANLAYWVTGTEGSNPSLSASFVEFFRPESSFYEPASSWEQAPDFNPIDQAIRSGRMRRRQPTARNRVFFEETRDHRRVELGSQQR